MDPKPAHDLENLAKMEAVLAQQEEMLWQIEELQRSSRVVKPTKRMKQYCLQQQLFPEGYDNGEQPWDAEEENQDEEPWETRMES